MNYQDYIKPELLALVPVLYLLGTGLKKSQLPNKYIPLLLGGVSILLCALWVAATALCKALPIGRWQPLPPRPRAF